MHKLYLLGIKVYLDKILFSTSNLSEVLISTLIFTLVCYLVHDLPSRYLYLMTDSYWLVSNAILFLLVASVLRLCGRKLAT